MTNNLILGSGFNMENMRRILIREREMVRADTPIGHRCSNLVEQIENYYFSTDQQQRESLMYSIAKSLLEIRDLRLGNRIVSARSKQQLMLAYQ